MKTHPTWTLLCVLLTALLFATTGCTENNVTASEKTTADESASSPAAAKADSTTVIVTVNGATLTEGDIQEQIDAQMNMIKQQVPPEQLEKMMPQIEQMSQQMRDKLVDSFITRTVLTQEANRQKITVPDAELEAKIQEFKQQLPADMTLESALEMSGTTLDKMREEMRFGMQAEKLIDSQVPYNEKPSETEIKDYYEQNRQKFEKAESVHARHILLKTAESDNQTVKDKKRAEIDSIHAKLAGGGDFAELAKEHSQCPSSAKGGDLGTFSRGRMVKPFEDAAFSQKAGEVGPVVETRFGYHIIEVLEHNQPETQTLEQTKEKIVQTLASQNKNEAIQTYLKNLKDKAEITYGTGPTKP